MTANLERSLPLAVPAERQWELLQEIEQVAVCMPGASITEGVEGRLLRVRRA